MNTPLKPADSMPGSFGLPIIGEGLDMAFDLKINLEQFSSYRTGSTPILRG